MEGWELRVRTYVAQVDGIRAQLWETFPNGKNGEPYSGSYWNGADCEFTANCETNAICVRNCAVLIWWRSGFELAQRYFPKASGLSRYFPKASDLSPATMLCGPF